MQVITASITMLFFIEFTIFSLHYPPVVNFHFYNSMISYIRRRHFYAIERRLTPRLLEFDTSGSRQCFS